MALRPPTARLHADQEAPVCTALRPASGTAPRCPTSSTLSDPGATWGHLGPGQLCITRSHVHRATSTGDAVPTLWVLLTAPVMKPQPRSKGLLHLPSSDLTLQKMPKAERGRDGDSGKALKITGSPAGVPGCDL